MTELCSDAVACKQFACEQLEMTPAFKPRSSTATVLIQSLVRDISRVLGKRVAVLVGVTMLTALLEGVTIALLLPLFGALGFAGGSAGMLTRALVRLFTMIGLPHSPLSVGCVMLVVLMTSGGMFLLQAYYSTRLQAKYVAHWRRQLFEALTAARWSFLRQLPSGNVAAALTTEAMALHRTFGLVNLAFSSSTSIVLQIAIAFLIAPVATGILLLFGVALFLLTLPLIQRAIGLGTAHWQSDVTFQARTKELTSAMKLIKATAVEDAADQLLNKSIAELERLNFLATFDVQIARATFEYLSAAAIALLLISGPLLFGIEISTIIVVLAIFVRLFPRITGLRQSLQMIVVLLPGFLKIQEIYERALAAREEVGARFGTLGRIGPASVRLRDVSVCGDDGTVILEGINLDILPGSYTAIVGVSGAGKTTLIDCVLGLVEPQRGQIFVDDVPIRELSPASWRGGIGYIGQDPILFAGTIRENVTWGATDIDDTAVISALSNAGAEFVFQLPSGIDTPVAEGGGSLSGGERQRIALARAFCRATWLLILDEAMSALDSETESAIAAALRRLKGRFTVLAVSHRLSSIRDADDIVVLDAGRIIERGRLTNLLMRQGKFSALWNTQSSAPIDAA